MITLYTGRLGKILGYRTHSTHAPIRISKKTRVQKSSFKTLKEVLTECEPLPD